MTLNLADAENAKLETVNVTEASGLGAGIDLVSAPTAQPPQANVQVSKLDGITEAGVDLARTVLIILSAALVLLLTLYSCSESKYTGLIDKPLDHYTRAIESLSGASSSPVNQTNINDAVATLKSIGIRIDQHVASQDTNKPPLAFDRQPIDAAISGVTMLKDNPSQSPIDVQKLKDVIVFFETAKTKPEELLRSREKISSTLAALQEIQNNRPSVAAEVEKLKAFNELMKTMNEGHKEARASWFSLAQMVLVNVLLPVLTALLGYIFGSSRRT